MAVTIDVDTARAFIHIRKGENQAQFSKPAELTGDPVPVWCDVNTGSLFADEDATQPLFVDTRERFKDAPRTMELVDARSLKFDYEYANSDKTGFVNAHETGLAHDRSGPLHMVRAVRLKAE
jgi:hypothetical protein